MAGWVVPGDCYSIRSRLNPRNDRQKIRKMRKMITPRFFKINLNKRIPCSSRGMNGRIPVDR